MPSSRTCSWLADAGSAVVVAAPWLSKITSGGFAELDGRLAPGRPPVTLAAETRPLADILHDLAAQLRAALTGKTPAPLPTRAVTAPTPDFSWRRSATRADYELLCARARAAVRSLPSEAQRRADPDDFVSYSVIDAADNLSRLLEGEEATGWLEFPQETAPAFQTVRKGVQTRTLADVATHLATIANQPAPRPPLTHEALEDYEHPVEPTDQVRLIPLPSGLALVLSEVLDEYAARVTPHQHIGQLLFDSYPLCSFLRHLNTRLQAL